MLKPKKRPDTPLAKSTDPEISYNKKYSDRKKLIEKTPPQSGVEVSPTGTATAKPYEKKFVPATAKRTRSMIIDAKGKVVKAAESSIGPKTANKNLYREYQRDSTNTMDRRNRNANFRNINVGSKKELSDSDKKSLLGLKKINKNG
jgi:hypothetical protein